MRPDKKRYLVHFFPELLKNLELPLNIEFTQFFTMDAGNEKDLDEKSIPIEEQFIAVKITAYQTANFRVFSTLGKPISKMIR